MQFILQHIDLQETSSLSGKVLVSMPYMVDKTFQNTVILICSHNHAGATGVIVNRTLPGLTFKDLLAQIDVSMRPICEDQALYYGGPMDIRKGVVLHSLDYRTGSTDCVKDTLGVTTNLEILKALAQGKGPKESLIMLGFASWDEGQLEKEISQNDWFIMDASHQLIFHTLVERKWEQAFAIGGVDLAHFQPHAGNG